MANAPVSLLGVRIDSLSVEDVLHFIADTVERAQRAQLMYVNSHALNIAFEQPRFRAVLNNADVVFCDGFGVKWGARLQGKQVPYRYTPPDWIDNLCELCLEGGLGLFLLGGRYGVAEKAAAVLVKAHPGLQISGTKHGLFDKTAGSVENQAVVVEINQSAAHILVVGFGMPLQEYWVSENWAALHVNVVLTAGALFDYVAGEVWRGPRWMTDHGLEWLARLVVEPARLWRRYIWGIPLFLGRVLLEMFGLLRLRDKA